MADQFGISRVRVQQLAKEYRDTVEMPIIQTLGRKPYATYPADLESRVLAVHEMLGCGAVAVAHVLREDGLSIDNNRVHAIFIEHASVTENTNKQGRKRPWVRFEREYSLVTAHMDWYQNDRGEWCIAVEDDASRLVLAMIETQRSSSAKSVEVLDEARQAYKSESDVPILEVITDHGSEFINTNQDERPCPEHTFEGYLDKHDIKHTLCKVGRPQSKGKLERFYQTYEKHRWRFGSLDEFLTFYNVVRPHMSLDWDALETPKEAFDRLLPQSEIDIEDPLATEVTAYN